MNLYRLNFPFLNFSTLQNILEQTSISGERALSTASHGHAPLLVLLFRVRPEEPPLFSLALAAF